MNIINTPMWQLMVSFAALEGMPWVEGSLRKSRYSLLGALCWLEKLRDEAAAEATQQVNDEDADWCVVFAEQLRDRSFEIYGNGGINRYYVDGHGAIRFSKGHSLQKAQNKANRVGFVVI